MKKAAIVSLIVGCAGVGVAAIANRMRLGAADSEANLIELVGVSGMAVALLAFIAASLFFTLHRAGKKKAAEQAALGASSVFRMHTFGRVVLWVAGIVTLPILGFGMLPIIVAQRLRVVIAPTELRIWRGGTTKIGWDKVTSLEWKRRTNTTAGVLVIHYTNPRGKARMVGLALKQYDKPLALRQAIIDGAGQTLPLPNGDVLEPMRRAA